jgi:hypothetical protein
MGPGPMNSRRGPLRLALLTSLLAGCATVQAASPHQAERLDGKVRIFGKWAAGCSNLRTCTAIVPLHAHDGVRDPFYLQMTFSGNFSDAEGFAIMRGGERVAALSPQVGAALAKALLADSGGETVPVTGQGVSYNVPREGFVAVMAALESWRAAPPSATATTVVVTPLPAERLDNPVPQFKPQGGGKRCPVASMGQSLQAWRGFGGRGLWRVGCGDEGLNSTSYWYFAGPQGAPPTEIRFEDRDGPVTLYNSWFDADSGYLRSVHYFGHFQSFTDDCGIYRSYAWDFQGFKLVEQRQMPQCETGIGPEGWIITYRATVLGGTGGEP